MTKTIEFKHKYYLRAGRYMSYLIENQNGRCKCVLGDSAYYDGQAIETFMRNLGPLATSAVWTPEGFIVALDKIPEKPSTKLDELLEQVLAL